MRAKKDTPLNYIREYHQQIVDSEVCVNKWVRLAYNMIIEGLNNGSFFYDHTKAELAIQFIEHYWHHHEGALAPGLLKLELWQKAFYAAVFGIVDENGDRQWREVFLGLGRKNGKTLMMSGTAGVMSYVDGEYGAQIYFCGPKLAQASLCYNAFYQSVQKEPELDKISQKRRSDIYIKDTNTIIMPLAYNAKTSDGLNLHLGVCDEVAAWRGEGGLRFYEVLKSSMGARRQPLLISISTAGYENEGIYDELVKRATRVLEGDSKEKRFLPIMYGIDDVTKWNDLDELRKANPNLGVSITEQFLLDEIAVAEGSLSKKAEFLTKYCNVKQNVSSAFLSYEDVERACGDPLDIEQFRKHYCVVGIDLSQTMDLTSVCAVVEKNGELYIFSKFFLPASKLEEATARDGLPYEIYVKRGLLQLSGENFVDYKDVSQWIFNLVKKHKLYPLVIGYDRYSANYLISELEGNKLVCDDVWQGSQLYPILKQFEGLLKDGKIHIGDNDLLKVHMLNSAIHMDTEKNRGRLVKISPNDHIDGFAAVIDAMTVRDKWWAQYGKRLQNTRK